MARSVRRAGWILGARERSTVLSPERGDAVFLSPFLEHAESGYAQRARAESVLPLDAAGSKGQYCDLRDGIRRSNPGVTVARYDIREFVY